MKCPSLTNTALHQSIGHRQEELDVAKAHCVYGSGNIIFRAPQSCLYHMTHMNLHLAVLI